MVHILLLISIESILTFSLLDRCKLYNINPKDCQNSVYIPNSSYDEYLKSFNIPIQKDPECDKKNCVIVVYRDPARISVNTTHNPNNPGCHLQNASDCIPNLQNSPQNIVKQQDTQEKEPPIIIHKSIYVNSDSEEKSPRKRHSQEDSDNEDDEKTPKKKYKTVTETVTQSVPLFTTSKDDSEKASEKSCNEKDQGHHCSDMPSKVDSVPKTVIIHERDLKENPESSASHEVETVTIHDRDTSKKPEASASHKPETVTIYDRDTTESPHRTASYHPETVTIHEKETTQSQEATISPKPETVTIYKQDLAETPRPSISLTPETVTIYKESPQATPSNKPEISTIYEQKATESPPKIVSVTVEPTIRPPTPPEIANTPKAIESVSPGTSRPDIQMICDKHESSIDKSEFSDKFAELKTMIREKVCKQHPESENCNDSKGEKRKREVECDSDSSIESKCHHKKKKSNNEKANDNSEGRNKPSKKKKQEEPETVVTLTRVNTVTVTDEVPITLYREIEKIITKDNIVTKFKVKTEYKTVSIDKKPPEPSETDILVTKSVSPIVETTTSKSVSPIVETTASKSVSPIVTLPIITTPQETISSAQIPLTSSLKIMTVKPHMTVTPESTTQDERYDGFLKKYFEKLLRLTEQKDSTINKNKSDEPPLISIPLVPTDTKETPIRDFSDKQEQNTFSLPAAIIEPKKVDSEPGIITERNKPLGDELSKSLIPLFGQFLEKISKESLSKVKKDEDSEIHKPDIKTVFLTTTEFLTETIRQQNSVCSTHDFQTCNKTENCNKKEGKCVIKDTDAHNIARKPRTIYNTVYKTAPMKMKCRPVIQNKVNCMIIREGTVFKTIQDGKEGVETTRSISKKVSDGIEEIPSGNTEKSNKIDK